MDNIRSSNRKKSDRRYSNRKKSIELKIRQANRRTSLNSCPPGQIQRKEYRRHSYTRNSSGKISYVKQTIVPPTCINDVGQPGYGAQIIPPLTPNLLGQFGYSTHANQTRRRKALNQAVEKYGISDVYKHLRNIITLQRWNPSAHDIMIEDFNYLRRKYYPHRIGKYETIGY